MFGYILTSKENKFEGGHVLMQMKKQIKTGGMGKWGL